MRKEGPAYDLPIAVGVLAATQQVWPDKLQNALFVGELSLEGTTRHTKGILPLAALARQEGLERVFVPAADAEEAALMPDIEVIPGDQPGRIGWTFNRAKTDCALHRGCGQGF